MQAKYPAVLTIIIAIFLLTACGGEAATPKVETPGDSESAPASDTPTAIPIWRYVNSGWVSPLDAPDANAFSKELRAVIITSNLEMERFNRATPSKRTFGTGATLGRPEFPGSVVLAVYLMWQPFQGDPLSVVGLTIEGNRAVVDLELDEDAQGREYPYLFAPMTMVMVDRSEFPEQGPVEFEFRLDGLAPVIVSDSLE
ncbi:MAG: hypothetical protein O3A93_02545 [Chloroflexi bacterium]|nr:hypothetical protein [Chloroflexota bacterium]MDA1270127.1 hypothetical protein [Chloroflexota bacterium]PKB59046.1 MAG: hypothetical protein BZY83_03940 [SAR202 cluster bacterium Casp-Chloro-G2]